MSKHGVDPLDLAMGGAVAVSVAIAMAVLLSTLASPSEVRERTAELQQQADRAERALQVKATNSFSPSDICGSDLEIEAATLRTSISKAITNTRLSAGTMDVSVSSPERDALTPILLHFEATGAYEDSLALLSKLAAMQPKLFIQALDLNSKTSNVTLSLDGAVYCDA